MGDWEKGGEVLATIVTHKKAEKNYVLLGTGFGAYKTTRPSFLGGNLFPKEDEGTIQVVAVCDKTGSIYWIPSSELQVVKVEGKRLGDIVVDIIDDSILNVGECPACGWILSDDDIQCPSCKIFLPLKK